MRLSGPQHYEQIVFKSLVVTSVVKLNLLMLASYGI